MNNISAGQQHTNASGNNVAKQRTTSPEETKPGREQPSKPWRTDGLPQGRPKRRN